MAGFFDAEGCVGVYRSNKSWALNLSIAGTYKPIFEKLYKQLELGCLSPRKKQLTIYHENGERTGKLQKQVWVWQFRRQSEAKQFLLMIRPHLREKAKQVDIFLDWIDKRIDGKVASEQLKAEKKSEFQDIDCNQILLSSDILDPEYMAGFFDGDGSVGIYPVTGGYGMKVSVAGSYKPNLDALLQTTGVGKIHSAKRHVGEYDPLGKFGKKCRQSWRWQINSKTDAKTFLSIVVPHLQEKKAQAEAAIKWIDGSSDVNDTIRILDIEKQRTWDCLI